ncbi:MAG: hypothetical protein WAT39_06235 [Planctomycetota bacterium]
MPRRRLSDPLFVVAVVATGCGGGGSSSTPIAGADVAPDLVACRARVDDPLRSAEIALRDVRNLGTRRVGDRNGTERRARVHPDGVTVVFARERENDDPRSRELFVSTLDNSRAEVRLTQNTGLDDEPCWSPDGERILFTSDRGGAAGLWWMAADGGAAQSFQTPLAGGADGEADWHGPSGRIAWSRRDAAGRHTLWIANETGNAPMPLTDGGAAAGAGPGDQSPAFAPDGASIVFVRRTSPTTAALAIVDVATAAVTVLFQPAGDVALPRIAPTLDRVFFGLAEPDAGRPTLRLAWIPVAGGDATLLWPDERWGLEGLELLPSLPPLPAAGESRTADVGNADVQIATASSAFGVRDQLVAADGDEFELTTATFNLREVAGINCRINLPIDVADDVLAYEVRVIARCSRIDGDSVLRLSLYNPLESRSDTVVELTPPGSTAQTLTFRSSSLRHVTQEKQLRVSVIADLAPGARATFRIDLVEVVVLARAPAAPAFTARAGAGPR